MSLITCSNSNPRASTSPDASAQNMNASSGSGLWPSRISIESGTLARTPTYTERVRKPPLSDAIQDYLKEIYKLAHEDDGSRVTVTALAKQLGVSAPSVSGMVKKLAALGL